MITAKLSEADAITAGAPGLEDAITFLRRADLAGLPDGRYELPGGAFANVERYETRPSPAEGPRFEAHRLYTDVQYIVSGAETIGVAALADMEVLEAYDPARDICFGRVAEGRWEPAELEAGELAVLSPADAHAPKMPTGAPAPVMKVVVKLPV